MAQDFSAEGDGRRAWDRLAGWLADADPPDDGNAALDALGDVGVVRRLLDRAELVSVRAARRSGRSWSEIATRLGVTRQSAWERWRDLDDDDVRPAVEAAAERVVTRVVGDLPRRKRGTAVVPDIVGLSFDDARDVLVRTGLVPVNADPDSAPLQPDEWHASVVVRQYPDSGTRLRAGSPVKLWVERGGGTAGVREPRRPPPPVREASGEIDLDAVVGD